MISRFRFTAIAAFIATLVGAASQPARADLNSITPVQIGGGPGVVTPCPATIQFQATVQGNAGEAFGWIYLYTLGGVQHVSAAALTPAVVDATGHAILKASVVVNGSTSPGDSFQFNTVTSDSNHNFNSPAIPFTVSCSLKPGSLLPPNGGFIGQVTDTVDQAFTFTNDTPANPRIIVDPKDPKCDPLCNGAITNRGLVIAFNYNQPAKVDGYRLYGTGLATPLVSKSMMFELPAPASGDFSGKCYRVTAYQGTAESKPSPDVCATSTSSLHYALLKPKYLRTELVGGGAAKFNSSFNNGMGVGYVGVFNQGNQSYNEFWRMAMYYDFTAIYGRAVSTAQLTLQSTPRTNPQFGGGGSTGQCGTQMTLAKNSWWNGTPGIAIDPAYSVTFNQQVNPWPAGREKTSIDPVYVDVTTYAKIWAADSKENLGIVIKQPNEDSSDPNVDVCQSVYDTWDLAVVYR